MDTASRSLLSTTAQGDQILVVDGNASNLNLIYTFLSDKNFGVRLATSGTMALNSVKVEIPNLILLDVNMPAMDGHVGTRPESLCPVITTVHAVPSGKLQQII